MIITRTLAVTFLFVLFPIITGCGQATKSNKDPSSEPSTPPSKKLTSDDRTLPKVTLMNTPDKGIQPQATIDDTGTFHLIYFKGDAAAGDLFYVHKDSGGKAFSKPLRVNSMPNSVIAKGNVRGAHMALGKNKRVHVAWMGSSKTKSPKTQNESPMLYTRLAKKGDRFEKERNVIWKAYGLDGGGSVAADKNGNVYVVWHAPVPGKEGEEHRQVWVAHSKDDGKTFAQEKAVFDKKTGACGCCGMRAYADAQGALYVLYRSATNQVHRDIYLLRSSSLAKQFVGVKLDEWPITACPMSTMNFGENQKNVLAAWETDGQVYFAKIYPKTGKTSQPIAAPGKRKNRKHPVVVANSRGEVLLAWTEGMAWNRGGKLVWQVFDKNGKATPEKGKAPGVPAWSILTAIVLENDNFIIVR